MWKSRFAQISVLLLSVCQVPASAHPHIFATVTLSLVYDGDRFSSIREVWNYDAAYSTFIRNEADQNRDGQLSDEELTSQAQKQIQALSQFSYFTKIKAGDEIVSVDPATDVGFTMSKAGDLRLAFTLPLRWPIAAKAYSVEIFDPEFFAFLLTPKAQ